MLNKIAELFNANVHEDFLAPAVAGLYGSDQVGTLTTREKDWLELFKNLNATNQAQILNAGQIILMSQQAD